MNISQQRCFNHAGREAAIQCLECRRFFCRECATEHENRVVCATCLRQLSAATRAVSRPCLRKVWSTLQVVLGTLVLWLFFYMIAQALLNVPSEFHQGKGWAERLVVALGLDGEG